MRIAIVKLSSLGDIIHAMLVLQCIKQQYPDALIDWVIDDKFKEIVEENPHIYTIIPLKIKHYKQQKSYKKLFLEIWRLKKLPAYDFVIDMQGLIKSAIIAKRIPSRHTVGFDKHSIREKFASYFYNKSVAIAYTENTILRNLAVALRPLNIKYDDEMIDNKHAFLFSTHAQPYQNYIVFVVNSNWESRNYPVKQFIEVADGLQQQVYVLWASESEQHKAREMSKQSGYIKVAPKLSLVKLKAFIAGANLVIGNDTGPTHIAWGVNVPSITLFGPTPTNRIYTTKINQSLASNSKVDHYNLDKNDFSISEIPPTDVIHLAHQLLAY